MRKPIRAKKPVRRITSSKKESASKPQTSAFSKARAASDERASGSTAKVMRGDAGFNRGKKEAEKQRLRREQSNLPFRLWLKPGESREFVILDDQPAFFYEHNWAGPDGKYNKFARCIQDTSESCPLCAELGREGYYVMMCTVVDKHKFKDRKGKTHNYSQKLLPVKTAMQPQYQRKVYQKQGGTMRGAIVRAHRDGEKDSSIGNDIEYVGRMSEAKLKSTFPAELLKVVDYDKAWPAESAKNISKRHNLERSDVAGSEDFGDDDDDDSAW